MNIRRALSQFLRPMMVRLPFGRHMLYKLLVGRQRFDKRWINADGRFRIFKDHHVQQYVYADLYDWAGRHHFFTGDYRDIANGMLIEKLLSQGDTYVDIGANNGIFSLWASRVVGSAGRVISFEPNPSVFKILSFMTIINKTSNITLHNVGLSDEPAILTLHGADEHTGTFSFRPMPEATVNIDVPVERGDAVLTDLPDTGRILIKIDTEGWEHHVLAGLGQLVHLPNVDLSVEITDAWLRFTGTTAADLFEQMEAAGFDAYHIETVGRSANRSLQLTKIDKPLHYAQYDVLFTRRTIGRSE